MICNKCGNSLPDDTKFCTGCGNKIEEVQENLIQQEVPKVESQQTIGQVQTNMQQQQQNIPQNENNYTDREPSSDSKYALMSVGGYIGAMIIMLIPIIGWIVAIIWALGGTKKINKRNFARAMLVITIIVIIIAIIIGAIFSMLIDIFKETISTQMGIDFNELNMDKLMEMFQNGELPFEIPENLAN